MSQAVKAFIKIACEFDRHKDVDTVVHHLQILSASNDLSVFDPSSFEATEFYTILYDLLVHHSSSPDLVWNIINVLQAASRNPDASTALVQTYHFIFPLTTILDGLLLSEKKLVLLKLIQELTYGLVICWQESYLPNLVKLLVDIIRSSDNDLIPVALGVLVNLCHKNRPAIYTLMNCIDLKTFLRTVLNLQRDNVEISIQVCKLMVVLNQLSGNVPDPEILSFVRVSYLRISYAFRCENSSLMRHIVDFFRDVKECEQGRKVLLNYPRHEEEIDNLIKELCQKSVPNNRMCVYHLLDFMRQLVDLELLPIMSRFPLLANSVLPWIQVEGVARTVLELLTTMLRQSRTEDADVYRALTSCLERHLQMLVVMLNDSCKNKPAVPEEQEFLASLFHLLHELAAQPSLATIIASTVDKEELKNLLIPLTGISNGEGSHRLQQSVTALYVEVLSFMSALSSDDTEWLLLFSDLLQKKQILKALAIALYIGSCEVKKQILYLAGASSFSKQSLSILSKCLSDLNQLFLITPNTTNHNPQKCVSQQPIQLESSSYFTKTHGEQLDNLIEKLENLYKNNQIEESSLLEIIELYNYKLGVMRRAENSLNTSLRAADAHCIQLSHQVTQLSSETSRLHHMLYTGQQSLEGARSEVAQLREQLRITQQTATDSHIKFKQLKQDVQSKSMIIKDQTEEIFKKNQILDEFKKNCEQLEEANASLREKTNDQGKLIEKMELTNANLEDKIRLRDKSIVEKDVLIENRISHIKALEQEIGNHQGHIRGLEKTIKDKEKEIAAQQAQLGDLERMRQIIFEITGGKKSNL